MKDRLFTLLLFLASFMLISCSDDEDNNAGAYLDPSGGVILSPEEFPFEYGVFAGDNMDYNYPFVFEDSLRRYKERKPLAYDNMVLFTFYVTLDAEELRKKTEEIIGLQTSRSTMFLGNYRRLILDEVGKWERYGKHLRAAESSSFTSSIDGDVTITADKVLFGQEAGTDLSEHFNVLEPNPFVLSADLESPKIIYNAKEYMPTRISELFIKGSYASTHYAFYLTDIPEENYDEINFTVTIPVEDQYIYSYYKKLESDPKAQLEKVKRVISSTANVKFGKISELAEFDNIRENYFQEYLVKKYKNYPLWY